MKFIRFLTVMLLGLGCFSRPAAAAYMTAGDLLRDCSSDAAAQVESCMHYVAGVIDYQLMLQSLGTEPAVDFCLPRDLSLKNASMAVAVYLQKNPQLETFIAAPSVAMALGQAYPCAPAVMKKEKYRPKNHHGG